MYRHRAVYNTGYAQYPHAYSTYDMPERVTLANLNVHPSAYYTDRTYRDGVTYVNQPYYEYVPRTVSPTIIQTNVHNDISYHFDDSNVIYDDRYVDPYRLSHSNVEIIDTIPKHELYRDHYPTVVSTIPARQSYKRIVMPHANLIRHTALPTYVRQKPVRLMPLHHSADPHYLVTNRRRTIARELLPVTTVHNSYARPTRRIVKVRSLSP
jgi:hypothetical protein